MGAERGVEVFVGGEVTARGWVGEGGCVRGCADAWGGCSVGGLLGGGAGGGGGGGLLVGEVGC